MRSSERCWFCGREGVDLTDEHVLSEKNFGGRLVARNAICKRCNSRSGELEDQLARSVGVAELVGRYGAVFTRGRPPRPQTDGVLPDRSEVTVEYGPEGLSVRFRKPRLVSTDPDGTEVWEVAEGQEDLFVDRRQKRGMKVRAVGRPLAQQGGMNVTYGLGADNMDLWPRLGAKVALSLASMVVDRCWLDTAGARALQFGFWRGEWLHELYPTGAPWMFREVSTRTGLASLLRPGEHVVSLAIGEQSCVRILLFGALLYQLAIFDTPAPSEEYVWLLSPRVARSRPWAYRDLRDWLGQRAVDERGMADVDPGPTLAESLAGEEDSLEGPFWDAARRGRARARENLGLPPEGE